MLSIAKELVVAMDNAADVGLSEKVSKVVRRSAWIAAIVMAIPIPVVNAAITWLVLNRMYSKLNRLAGISSWKNFFKNRIVREVTTMTILFTMSIALWFIPVKGWLIKGVVGYFAVRLAAIKYLKTLTAFYEEENLKEQYDHKAAIAYITEDSKNSDTEKKECEQLSA